eukprot:1295169-Rhodomonas_salina.2
MDIVDPSMSLAGFDERKVMSCPPETRHVVNKERIENELCAVKEFAETDSRELARTPAGWVAAMARRGGKRMVMPKMGERGYQRRWQRQDQEG